MSDVAGIALRSWDVLSAHGPLVGQATRLARSAYDLGPLQYWLLTVPVHLDPVHGVLWGAALWCMLACSLTIEAARSVAGEFGGVLASVIILGVILWVSGSSGILGISGIPGITGLPAWNPWFGTMFFLPSLAAAWAVMAGHRGWWAVLMVTASIAAQVHLMFATPAAALVLVAFIVGMVDSFRGHTGFRWAAYGLIAALACWLAPLIQQFTAQTGNLTALVQGEFAHRETAGLSFGLKALTASVQPPPLWWTPWASLPGLAAVGHRSAAFGVAALVLAAVALAVAIYPLRSRRTAALAAVSLLVSVTALVTYSGVPLASITTNSTSLNYLMAPMFLIGVLAWLVTGSVAVLIGRRAISRVRAREAEPADPGAGPVTEPRAAAARWAIATTGCAVAVLIALAALGIGFGKPSSGTAGDPLIRAVNAACEKIERKLPGQAIGLEVTTRDSHSRRRITFGLVYALRTVGYRPEVTSGFAKQLGDFYEFRWASIPRVTVYPRDAGASVAVRRHGGP